MGEASVPLGRLPPRRLSDPNYDAVSGNCRPSQSYPEQPAYSPWVEDDKPESGKGFEAAVAYAVVERLDVAKEDVVWTRTTFGVQTGTSSQRIVYDIVQPKHEAMIFNNSVDVVQALKNKQIQAIVVDLPTALDLVGELKQQGTTILMATHEIGFARQVADRVVFLEQGRIAEEGPPEQVIDDPQVPATRDFLARVLR